MIMLDTTACIDYLNGEASIKKSLELLNYNLYISSISVYEIFIGLEKTKQRKSEKRYKELYIRWREFCSTITIISLGIKEAEKAAEIYEMLELKGIIIDDHDILIAGIMRSNGIKKILTRNLRHFEKIEAIEPIGY